MKIILIGNYTRDRQESMNRFVHLLAKGFGSQGLSTEIWIPASFFGKFFTHTNTGYRKWFGYIDKWIVFPIILTFKLSFTKYKRKDYFFHVADHSNSPYLSYLPANRKAITCHDVLAIRGAFGHKDAFISSTRMGKVLQNWILQNLLKAERVVCVSSLTKIHLEELRINYEKAKNKGKTTKLEVIYNSFNNEFKPLKKQPSLLSDCGINTFSPYILHVGSDLLRKNRKLLLDMAITLKDDWTGYICLAGDPIEDELKAYAKKNGIYDRLIEVIKPDHEHLLALYSSCEAFIFPSFSEGFGWPLIEAQACGAPVIASDIYPMPEVGGEGALYNSPYDAVGFAKAFKLLLKDDCLRQELINKGFKNTLRFETRIMTERYLKIFRA
ncbi:glycosyltransferase [Anditalea andensis]|uniref:Glycosyl transferase family 1 domain-containing protein n=1 Tax=Anditalea andensis TaxID=1048983 RepID=A0A074KQS0_9BACT|nr:glycosyltransferase [Anditalea andensis]KEO72296.1 hypothetical protein EL17_16225 [Anditalea andensis]